jgi:N-acetylglucosamine malate deacetylase 1
MAESSGRLWCGLREGEKTGIRAMSTFGDHGGGERGKLSSLFGMSPGCALVVAPHADDEVLGAGGIMARLAASGWKVHVLFATVAGYPSMARKDVSSSQARLAEAEAALKTLRAASYEALFHEANHLRLDAVPQCDLIDFVQKGICGSLSIAIVPSRSHYHQDHRALADACAAALRPAPNARLPFVPVVLAYSSHAGDWGHRCADFRANVFVDITEFMETKLEALSCYASQMCESPHPRSLEAVRSWSAHWGVYGGVKYAEPFECLRFAVC